MIESLIASASNGLSSSISASLTAAKFYLFWSTMHWGAVQLYKEFCIPSTITGYILTPLMSQTPHCKSLNWLQQTSSYAFNSMTAVIITWGASFSAKWMKFT